MISIKPYGSAKYLFLKHLNIRMQILNAICSRTDVNPLDDLKAFILPHTITLQAIFCILCNLLICIQPMSLMHYSQFLTTPMFEQPPVLSSYPSATPDILHRCYRSCLYEQELTIH